MQSCLHIAASSLHGCWPEFILFLFHGPQNFCATAIRHSAMPKEACVHLLLTLLYKNDVSSFSVELKVARCLILCSTESLPSWF
mmetsp:Transcript_4287/g.27319  ORF Transcript_4287/g.27319 Transcript_4287/m.27319 type:complete len:84 (-) Transcript_4287:1570-1821(-)